MSSSPIRIRLLACLVPLALLLGWFSPWWMQGKVMAPFDILPGLYEPWRTNDSPPKIHNHFSTDAVNQYVPYRMWADKSLREDGYLGWNPHVFGGTPQYANTMVSGFDWGMWIHGLLDFWTAWHLAPMLYLFIAGAGMFIFLRARGCPPSIASLAALAYMANWQFITCLYFRQLVSSFCWIPWVLWALSPLFPPARSGAPASRPASWRLALTPFFLCLAFLGGTLQQHAFIVIVLGCVGLGILMDSASRMNERFRKLLWIAVLGGVAVCLAAFMLEPTIRLYQDNQRSGHTRGAFGYDGDYLQPLLNLISLPFHAFPFPLGRPQTLDLWKAFRSDFMNAGFMGTLPALVAIASLFSKKVFWGPRLMILLGLLVPLTPLVGYLYHRIHIVWILGGCWAAAELLAAGSPDDLRKWSRRLMIGSLVVCGLWLLVSLALLAFEEPIIQRLQQVIGARAAEAKSPAIQQWLQDRAAGFPRELALWHPWQLVPAIGALLSFISLRWIRLPDFKSLLPTVGVAIQLSAVWFVWASWSEEHEPYGKPPGMQELARLVGHGRLGMPPLDKKQRFMPSNTPEPVGIAVLEGYDSIHPLGIVPDPQNPLQSSDGIPLVTHLLTLPDNTGPPGWLPQGSFWGRHLWKHPSASTTAFLKTVGQDSLYSMVWTSWTMNRRKLDVPPANGEVIVAENWHRDWRYRLPDGPWQAPAMGPDRTIHIPVSFEIPTTLELKFTPHSVRWPLWLSAAALLASVALLIIAIVRSRIRPCDA